jgi:hypothetical protein
MLTYACATVGAVMTPLDVRLMGHEVVRDMSKINPVAFFCLGNTPIRDFRDLVKEVQQAVPSVNIIYNIPPAAKKEIFSRAA